jgi:DNA modification methylase
VLKKTNAIQVEQLVDNVTLYCGDSRDIVPTLKGVDTVISDLPYGIEDLVGGYGRGGQTIANDKNLNVVGEVMMATRKVLTKNAWVAAFYSARISPIFFKMMEASGYKDYFGEMIWDKRAPGMGGQIRYQHENIAFYKVGKPVDLMDCMSLTSFASLKGDAKHGGNDHPHEKPDQVMQNIVGVVPGKLILDPFAGTFSTGAAAVKLKRGFIGIEIDPKHFEIGLKKVSAALAQPSNFWE